MNEYFIISGRIRKENWHQRFKFSEPFIVEAGEEHAFYGCEIKLTGEANFIIKGGGKLDLYNCNITLGRPNFVFDYAGEIICDGCNFRWEE